MDYLGCQGLPEGVKVLEVGCGWGLAGIFCAKHFRAVVTGVDADLKGLGLQGNVHTKIQGNVQIEFH